MFYIKIVFLAAITLTGSYARCAQNNPRQEAPGTPPGQAPLAENGRGQRQAARRAARHAPYVANRNVARRILNFGLVHHPIDLAQILIQYTPPVSGPQSPQVQPVGNNNVPRQ